MNHQRISDGEWKVMQIIWEKSSINAREVVEAMRESDDWNKNTTYTVLNRLIQKNMLRRNDPGFICIPLVLKEDIVHIETCSFIEKIYDGSLRRLVSNFLSKENISEEEISALKQIIEDESQKNHKQGGIVPC